MDIRGNASLWKRFFAYVVDFLVINIIILWPFKDYFIQASQNIGMESFKISGINSKFFAVSLAVAFLTILYWAILEFFTNQSVGKMIFDIKVKSLKSHRFFDFFIRNISKISIVVLVIDCFYIFFNKDNQRIFEKISSTKVVERGISL